MGVPEEKLGRRWRILRRKNNQKKGCKVRGTKKHLRGCLARRRERGKPSWRKAKAADTEEQEGSDEPERAGVDVQGEGERRESGPKSVEVQREQGESEPPGPEGEGTRVLNSTAWEEGGEKRAGAEEKVVPEGEKPWGRRGTPEPEQQQESGPREEQVMGSPPVPTDRVMRSPPAAEPAQRDRVMRSPPTTEPEQRDRLMGSSPPGPRDQMMGSSPTAAEPGRKEADKGAAEPGGVSLGLLRSRHGEAEPGSPMDERGERRAGLGVPEGQRRAEELEEGAAANVKERGAEGEREEDISGWQEGAGGIPLEEEQLETPRDTESHQNGAGSFNSNILLN